jgi:hypothetical protein
MNFDFDCERCFKMIHKFTYSYLDLQAFRKIFSNYFSPTENPANSNASCRNALDNPAALRVIPSPA